MTGRNLTNLYEKVDMDMLPTEYLPDDYTGSKVGSAKDIIGEIWITYLKLFWLFLQEIIIYNSLAEVFPANAKNYFL